MAGLLDCDFFVLFRLRLEQFFKLKLLIHNV